MDKVKNNILSGLYTILIGIISGLIIWAFLMVMKLGINFLWDYLPEKIDFKYYPIIVMLIL